MLLALQKGGRELLSDIVNYYNKNKLIEKQLSN